MSDSKLHATERLNDAAKNVHRNSVRQNLEIINAQNAKIAAAIDHAIPAIDSFVTTALERMRKGGRLFYIGAGTSGRLGVLDASECPPTFGVDASLIQGIMAGGDHALRHSLEGVEDDADAGMGDSKILGENDILVGISASGSAVYVRAAVASARHRGIYTAAICTAPDAPLLNDVDCPILAPTPPEIPAGSTRMFSGTAQKMILNMITTTLMIALGKVYAGYMIDVKISNQKLEQRAVKMIATLSGCPATQAQAMVDELKTHTQNPVKPAILMVLENCSYKDAVKMLDQSNGRIDAVMARYGRDTALGAAT
jgi:N-acetylmuramic acid 6-phosphate etherase